MPLLVVIAILSMYLFWNEARKLEKPANNIFDEWWISLIVTVVWGRVAYIVGNWSLFADSFWQWAPYERYGDQVYLFRAMPWRVLTVWDGGFLFSGMLFAFLLINLFIVIRLKHWRLREMYVPIILTQSFMLGAVFFVYGSILQLTKVTYYGLYMVAGVALFKLIYMILKKILKYRFSLLTKGGMVLTLIYTFLMTWLISASFFTAKLTVVDTLHVYGYIGLILITAIMYLFDINKKYNSMDPSDFARPVIPTRNQAIKAGLISGDVTK
ncbi:MAG: hypothetical protein Fur003_4810 [Candidatus Dojkabacteria bacterium]